MSSTKTSQVIEEKPKRALNAILKSMNDYRNNVIGAHIGTKAPRKTAPIFKLTLALARTQMGIDEKSKNTTEIVDKASEIFSSNPDKFVQLAVAAQEAEAAKEDTSTETTKGKKKSTSEPKVNQKSKKASVKEDAIEAEEPIVKAKGKSKKASAKEEPIVKAEGKSKKASAKEDAIEVVESKVAKVKKISVKKTPVKQIIDSDSNSDSNSDSDSD